MQERESTRPALVEYARIFGAEIGPEETLLEQSIADVLGFLADIDALDLEGVPIASTYDPAWPRVNEVSR